MSIWGDPPPPLQGQPAYAVGDRVCGAIDGVAGTVVAVWANTFDVQWQDAVGAVVYPFDTIMVRRAWPWELE